MTIERKFFLISKGPSGGPHNAACIRELVLAGDISTQVKVCGERSNEWLTVEELLARVELDPEFALEEVPDPTVRVRAKERGVGKWFRFMLLALAVALWWVPWLEVRVESKTVGEQSGWQVLAKDYTSTKAKGAKQTDAKVKEEERKKQNLLKTPAWWLAATPAALAGAIILSLAGRARFSGLLALLAGAMLATQMAIGFPLERSFAEIMAPLKDIQEMDAPAALKGFWFSILPTVQYTVTIWLELALLVVGGALAFCNTRMRAVPVQTTGPQPVWRAGNEGAAGGQAGLM